MANTGHAEVPAATPTTPLGRLRLTLEGPPAQAQARHLTMPLVKQFCTVQTGEQYGRYCRDWRALTRCQLELLERFPIDIVNVLGYPYREAGDLGLQVRFPDNAQPQVSGVLVERREDLHRLSWPDPRRSRLMSDRVHAIARFKELRPDIVAMGACEAPFALANTLMGIERAMTCLHDDPDLLRAVMEWIEPHAVEFARAQVEAGADMVFMGDALASQVSPETYIAHVLEIETRVVGAIQSMGVPVRLHICGDISPILPHVVGTGARFIDIDYPVDVRRACGTATEVNPRSFVVGNIDPVSILLHGTPAEVAAACRTCGSRAEGYANFIVAPGCEVPPHTPAANYQALIEHCAAV